MKAWARRTLLIGFGLGTALAARPLLAREASLELRTRIDLADTLERRLRQSISDFLGPETRAVVSVTVLPPTASARRVSDLPLSDESAYFLPISPYLTDASPGDENEASVFSAATVRVQVEKTLDPALIAELEKLVRSSWPDLKLEVEVRASLNPIANAKSEAGSANAPREPASATASPSSAAWQAVRDYALPALVAVALIASLLLSWVLKSAARDISASLKLVNASSSSSGTTSTQPSLPLPASAPRAEGRNALDDERPARAALPPPPRGDFRHNLKIIERSLTETPLLFARSVGDTPQDLLGLKFLIARLDAEHQKILKELLGMDRILKASSYLPQEDIVGFDALSWAQNLAERVETRKLVGGSLIDDILSKEEYLVLANATADLLFETARKSNTPATWRVATEFFSADFLRAKRDELDDGVWAGIVRGSYTLDAQEELRQAVRGLVETLRLSASENLVQLRGVRERESHFQERVLPALLDVLAAKDLGDDDAFLARVTSDQPEFAETIRKQIWTPSRLTEVPDSALKEVFLGPQVGPETRASLLYALPETHARRLESFLPEGNAKKIVLDLVQRMRAQNDPARRSTSKQIARDFLDHLRARALAGRLDLIAVSTGPGPSTEPVEAEVVDLPQDPDKAA